MKFPTIHLNGTSKERLLEALEEAHTAVRNAEEKLAETAPNGRDYYPQGPNAFESARQEHCLRMQKLHAVALELEELAERLAFA